MPPSQTSVPVFQFLSLFIRSIMHVYKEKFQQIFKCSISKVKIINLFKYSGMFWAGGAKEGRKANFLPNSASLTNIWSCKRDVTSWWTKSLPMCPYLSEEKLLMTFTGWIITDPQPGSKILKAGTVFINVFGFCKMWDPWEWLLWTPGSISAMVNKRSNGSFVNNGLC